jgi:hypothetical protein
MAATDSSAEKSPEVAGARRRAPTAPESSGVGQNSERARAAVTRYGGRRGESSEGCEARFRGGAGESATPRGEAEEQGPKRTEPHDRVQGATDLHGARGANRRSREERQGRNESGEWHLPTEGRATVWEWTRVTCLDGGESLENPMRGARTQVRVSGHLRMPGQPEPRRRAACDGWSCEPALRL